MDDIEASIEVDDAFFKHFIDMIPPQFYLDQDTKNELTDKQRVDLENKFKGKGKRHGQELSDKVKIKRMKYDPENQRTVSQIRESLAEQEAPSSGDDGSGSSEGDEEEEEEYVAKKNKKQRNKKSKKDRSKKRDNTELSHVDKYRMLQAKLRKKIEELQSRRLTPQEQIEKKRLKRKESKLKSKQRRRNKTHKLDSNVSGVNNNIVKSPPGGKPIFNKEGKMVFSKFDFTDSGEMDKPSNPLTGRDYKKLLEKVEKRKQRIREISEKNAEKGKELEDKIAWETALHKAQGVKVKDNPDMLKKALKQKEKIKERKVKKWEERVERTEKQQKDKQDKRRKNIKAKKEGNLQRKIAKQKKKGRMIPGF